MTDPADILRACFKAYADKDLAALEALLAPEFRFTSPYDRTIDRKTYMARCWPTSARVRRHHITDLCGSGDSWLVRYRLELVSGEVWTNMERFIVRDGLVREVAVYFGDPIPVPRPDFAASRRIPAPPAAVRRNLTTLDGLRSWWGNPVAGDPAPGGVLTFGFSGSANEARMRVDDVGGIAVQWTVIADDGFGGEWVGTKIRFELSEDETSGTVLDFRHIGLTPDLRSHAPCSEGWQRLLDAIVESATSAQPEAV